jgi:hypothetical protein
MIDKEHITNKCQIVEWLRTKAPFSCQRNWGLFLMPILAFTRKIELLRILRKFNFFAFLGFCEFFGKFEK